MLLKCYYHIAAFFKKVLFRLLYGRRISFGRGTTFRSGFHLMIEGAGRVSIGEHCFFNHGCSINCLQQVRIGDYTIMGEGVRIYDHNHRFADPRQVIKDQGYITSPVQIGSHCWIGSNVVLLRKASIGDHCVIGAGCVVNEVIPAGSLVIAENKLIRKSVVPQAPTSQNSSEDQRTYHPREFST